MRSYILIFFIFSSHYSFAQSAQNNQYAVSGVIEDKETNEPIVGASISWNNGTIGVVSDTDGRFSFNLEAGIYDITVSAVGKKNRKKGIKS